MVIYTKTGDFGKTSLLGGKRVSKGDIRLEAYGTVDELVSSIALARSQNPQDISEILTKIQEELFLVGSELAAVKPEVLKEKITPEHIEWLEKAIDDTMAKTSIKKDFIMPGPYMSSASLHLARTIARRAERHAVNLSLQTSVRKEILMYLNRLSDLLFALAKYQEEQEVVRKAVEKIMKEDKAKADEAAKGSISEITLDVAKSIISACEQKAIEVGVPMVISVVDGAGHLIALHRMDRALLASIEISMNKAYTSAAFKMPTSKLSSLAKPDGELFGINSQNAGRYVTFGGGYPVFSGSEVIGAIGVSGGNVAQDEAVAKAGLKILTEGGLAVRQ